MLKRVTSRSLLFAVLLVAHNARATDQTPTDTDAAEKRIAALEMRLGGRLGVAALDTGSSRRLEHRAGERFPMCSTFKLLAAAAVLHRVDEKKEQLTRFIPYTKADLLEHAPVTREHVNEGGMTLTALCAAAIEYSDNTAANLLLQTIGGPEGLTRYARSLGDEQTRLDRLEPRPEQRRSRRRTRYHHPGGDGRRTCAHSSSAMPCRNNRASYSIAGWPRTRPAATMIRAGLPNDWKIGDKTGRGENGATNDIAIIRPPGKSPILLAIYFVGSTASPKARQAAIADVARIVAETF